MIVETGATTAVFPSDERVREWLVAQGREGDFVELAADPGAEYDAARGDRPRRARAADREAAFARATSSRSPSSPAPKTVQVCVGSSVNSSYEDLARRRRPCCASETLSPDAPVDRDAGVAADPRHDRAQRRLPGPRRRRRAHARAGVRALHRGRPGAARRACLPSGRSTATSPGAAGRPATRCTSARPRPPPRPLCAARSPTRGRSASPPELAAGRPIRRSSDRQIVAPPPADRGAARRARPRGEHDPPPPRGRPVPDVIAGRVTIVVGDDVSTGDMAPDGAVGDEPLAEHRRMREVHVPPAGPRVPRPGARVGRRPDRRRPQLRPGLVARARRDRAALPRHPRRRRQELRAHPPAQPHLPGSPAARLRRTRRTTSAPIGAGRGGSRARAPRSPTEASR